MVQPPGREKAAKSRVSVAISWPLGQAQGVYIRPGVLYPSILRILNFCFGFDEISFYLRETVRVFKKSIFPLNLDDIISSDIPGLQIRWPLELLNFESIPFLLNFWI